MAQAKKAAKRATKRTPARTWDEFRGVVGWRIGLHRARLGWTLQQLADAVGGTWDGTAIGAVIKARPNSRGLTIEWLSRFAAALAVSPADLLLLTEQTDLSPEPPFVGDQAEQLAAEWRTLKGTKRPPLADVLRCNLARWRHVQGLTQAEVAERMTAIRARLGYPPWPRESVVHVERGTHGLELPTVAHFAAALGPPVTPADLVRLPRQPKLVPVETG